MAGIVASRLSAINSIIFPDVFSDFPDVFSDFPDVSSEVPDVSSEVPGVFSGDFAERFFLPDQINQEERGAATAPPTCLP